MAIEGIMNETKNVLLTGGAGFIGSHVIDILIEKGYRVICVDNLSKGQMSNIEHHADNPNFIFFEKDIMDRDFLFNLEYKLDFIIHMAASKIPRYSSAMNTLKINSDGTINIMDLAVKHGSRIVLASTSDVYGKAQKFPFAEDDDLVIGKSSSRRWSYAVSKLFDEHMAFAYGDEFNIDFVLLRFFGTYGERQYLNWWGGPQGVFLEAIYKDKPVDIHGDGSQTRCFIYVKDAAEGVVKAMESGKASKEIFNIGRNEEISILDLAKLMHKLSGSSNELKLQFIPYENFTKNYEDVMRRIPSTEKSENLLGFKADTSIEKGTLKLIKWYNEVILNK